MAQKFMYIPNDKQNYPFSRLQLLAECLDTQLNSIKVPKVVTPTNKKTLL